MRRLLALLLFAALLAGQEEENKPDAPADFNENLFTFEPVRLDAAELVQRVVITIHRWGKFEKDVVFTLKVLSKPPFVESAEWVDGDAVTFGPEETKKERSLRFKLKEAAKGRGKLVFSITAGDDKIVPRERKYEIPLLYGRAAAAAMVFALKEDAPDRIKPEELHKYIDPEATPVMAWERFAFYITPARDLDVEKLEFYWGLTSPDGKTLRSGLFTHMEMDKGLVDRVPDEAPGRFGGLLYRSHNPKLPAGKYKVWSAPELWDSGLLGIPMRSVGEKQEEGEVELAAPQLHLQGFVFEPFKTIKLERSTHVYDGRVQFFKRVREGAGEVTLEGVCTYRRPESKWDEQRRKRVFVPRDEPEQESRSRMTVQVPKVINPIRTEMGEMVLKLEKLRAGKARYGGEIAFFGGIYGLVPHRSEPAHRKLTGFASYAAPMFGTNTHTGFFKGTGWEKKPALKTFRRKSGEKKRRIAYHLRDQDTLFYIPFRLQVLDKSMYGFAVYRAKPGNDVGAAPTEGESGGADGAGDEPPPPGSVDPAQVNPNDPDISALIRAWQRAAEPPLNATIGAKLRYNEWGVMVGTTPTGIITGTPGKPDNVGARTSPGYLWSLRKKLDSVNHCTLEEYVVLRLKGKGIGGCRGRYRRQDDPRVGVPTLRGQSKKWASHKLAVRALKPRFKQGGEPPTRKLEYRVQSHEPRADSQVKLGREVTVRMYTRYIPRHRVPNLIGSPLQRVRTLLNPLRAAPEVVKGRPAPRRELEGQVYEQVPPPGTTVREGTRVRVVVYDRYKVPDPVRIVSVKALPDVARPGEWMRFEVRYQRLDLPRGREAALKLTASFLDPGAPRGSSLALRARGSEVQRTTFRWKVPKNARQGRWRMRFRLEERGQPPAQKDLAFAVSSRGQARDFYLRFESATASDRRDGRARVQFRYGETVHLIATITARECDLTKPATVTYATRLGNKPIAYLSQKDVSIRIGAPNRPWGLFITRTLVLPEVLPGRYTTTMTVTAENKHGEKITRSATTTWDVASPYSNLKAWFSDRENGAAITTMTVGSEYSLNFHSTMANLPRGVRGKIEITTLQGPAALPGTPYSRAWNFANGLNKIHHRRALPVNTRPGTYKVRVKVSLSLFPQRRKGDFWRSQDLTLRVIQPISNARVEVQPAVLLAGQRATVHVRWDLAGLAPGATRKMKAWYRAGNAQWVSVDANFKNGPCWARWTLTVPANFNGDRLMVEGLVDLGKLRIKARPMTLSVRGARPIITISSPRNGSQTNQKVAVIQGTISDKTLRQGVIVVNGRQARMSFNNGRFSEKTILKPGRNTIQIQAKNQAGVGQAGIQINANIRASHLKVILNWDTNRTDVDLWVTDPQGVVTSYQKRTGKAPRGWRGQVVGRKLDIDDKNGFGPETYTIETPVRGRYLIRIQYYRGNAPTNCTVTVVWNERQQKVFRGRLTRGASNKRVQGSTWEFTVNG